MSAIAGALPDPSERTARTRSTVVALAALTAVLTVVAGPTGTVAGLATALTWYGLGTPYALAAGHVVLAPAFPSGIGPATFLLAELGFLAVLLAAVVRPGSRPADAAGALVSGIGFVGVAWFVGRSRSVWAAAGVLLVAVGLAAYLVHRYELVRLGLVPDASEIEPIPDSDTDTDVAPDSPTHEQ